MNLHVTFFKKTFRITIKCLKHKKMKDSTEKVKINIIQGYYGFNGRSSNAGELRRLVLNLIT